MNKYERLLDALEHPDNYTPERLADIMSDPETGEIYRLLCKTDSAIEVRKEIDVEAEWKRFSKENAVRTSRSFYWPGSRAASVLAIIATSVVAVAAGIAVTMALVERKPMPTVDEEAPVHVVVTSPTGVVDTINDTVGVVSEPVIFEDASLEKIMSVISETYKVKVEFNGNKASSLRLYYKLDPALALDEIVEQLNTFEQINIKQSGDILTID